MKKFALYTDLDGTLLNSNSKISRENFAALEKIKSNNIINIAITGRNLHSATKILPHNSPIDYLVFSSGAGVFHWQTRRIIYRQNLNPRVTKNLIIFLLNQNVTFTIHKAIPLTHHFYYVAKNAPEDFWQRLELYRDFTEEYKGQKIKLSTSIIAMLGTEVKEFISLENKLKERFGNEISVIRSTSPINHKNIWLEIYNSNVSKGQTASWLSNYLSIDRKNTIAIGNDYNDLSLLEFAQHSFVVENAPEQLKQRFSVIDHHDNNAVAKLIEELFLTSSK